MHVKKSPILFTLFTDTSFLTIPFVASTQNSWNNMVGMRGGTVIREDVVNTKPIGHAIASQLRQMVT